MTTWEAPEVATPNAPPERKPKGKQEMRDCLKNKAEWTHWAKNFRDAATKHKDKPAEDWGNKLLAGVDQDFHNKC